MRQPTYFRTLSLYLELSMLVLQLWMCSLLCVCSLDSQTLYILLSHSQLDLDSCEGLGPPALRGEGAPKLQFLSGPSTAAGSTHRVFPLHLVKSPYLTVQSIFCIPWLHNFISAKIPLIVQVNGQIISQKPKLGARASRLSFHLLKLTTINN